MCTARYFGKALMSVVLAASPLAPVTGDLYSTCTGAAKRSRHARNGICGRTGASSSLSPFWRFAARSSYAFTSAELVAASTGIARDSSGVRSCV